MRHFVIVLTACLMTGCHQSNSVVSEAYIFGTLVKIQIEDMPEAQAKKLTDQVLNKFQTLHQRLHAWNPGSELSQLNSVFAQGQTTTVAPDVVHMLRALQRYSSETGFLFSPASGRLIQLWGFQRDDFVATLPDPRKIQELVRANPQMDDLMIAQQRVWSRNPAVQLDLGGYAKGYALDIAAVHLRQAGVKNALINIGGNIMALGLHGRKAWRVGIQHPRKAGPIALLDLPDGWAIGTSGDYQRFFELDGQRYCHIIDPRNGYPSRGAQSVTVLIPKGVEAGAKSDVYSKPLFIDAVHWLQWAERLHVEYAMIIDAQGKVQVTEGLRQRVQWVS